MTDRPQQYSEIRDLLFAFHEHGLTEAQAARLDQLVIEDIAARRFYIEMMFLHGQLRWEHRDAIADDASDAGIIFETTTVSAEATTASLPPLTAIEPHAPALHAFVGSPLFSYFVAAIIVGAGLLAAGILETPAYRLQRFAHEPSTAFPGGPAELAGAPRVARVTGMHRCKMTDARDRAAVGQGVVLGQRYSIASGLIEITYAGGARLVLQGPASYDVESATGGRLSLGRLTARVEARGAGRGERGEVENPSPLAPRPSPLFTITTPTATVIDLGTEFGVEVDAKGQVDVHVFSGAVECALPAGTKVASQTIRLDKDMAVQIASGGKAFERRSAERARFAAMPPPRPVPLAGFYPLDGDANDASGNGNHVDPSKIHGVTFVEGIEGKAAHFERGLESLLELPLDARPQAMPRMTWGAWVRPRSVGPCPNEVLSTDIRGYGRTLTIDYREGTGAAPNILRFATFLGDVGVDRGVFCSNGPLPALGEWTLVAGAFDDARHRVDLFVEDRSLNGGQGGMVHDRTIGAQFGPANPFVRVGRHATMGEPFDGDIDNVFIFREILTVEQMELVRRHGTVGILGLARGERLPDD